MYVLNNFAPGFVGLVMVGLLAAAMSSIDSAINSLSAATMEDFVPRRRVDGSPGFAMVARLYPVLGGGVYRVFFSSRAYRTDHIRAV